MEDEGDEEARTSANTEATLRWVRITANAGEVKVRTTSVLRAPELHGKGEMTLEGLDYEVRPASPGPLKRFRSAMRVGSLRVFVPTGWGIELDVRLCNVEISGVELVKGQAIMSNLQIEAVGGIDHELRSCNLEAILRPRAGRRRLTAYSSNVNISFMKGSSVRVTGQLSESSVKGALTAEGGVTKQLSGLIGSGGSEFAITGKKSQFTFKL